MTRSSKDTSYLFTNVVAALFDVDAIATSVDFKRTRVTELNEPDKGEYYQIVYDREPSLPDKIEKRNREERNFLWRKTQF